MSSIRFLYLWSTHRAVITLLLTTVVAIFLEQNEEIEKMHTAFHHDLLVYPVNFSPTAHHLAETNRFGGFELRKTSAVSSSTASFSASASPSPEA